MIFDRRWRPAGRTRAHSEIQVEISNLNLIAGLNMNDRRRTRTLRAGSDTVMIPSSDRATSSLRASGPSTCVRARRAASH